MELDPASPNFRRFLIDELNDLIKLSRALGNAEGAAESDRELWMVRDSVPATVALDLRLTAMSNLIGTITGLDVTASANGNQGQFGTFYVNINSTDAFSRVVASSTSNAFEFDNVAINPAAVPEPTFVALLGTGLVALAFTRRRLAGKRGLVAAG